MMMVGLAIAVLHGQHCHGQCYGQRQWEHRLHMVIVVFLLTTLHVCC